MRPVDVNEDNKSIVWQKLYGEESDKPVRFKFNIGDQVRISKARVTQSFMPEFTDNLRTTKVLSQRRDSTERKHAGNCVTPIRPDIFSLLTIENYINSLFY